MTAITKRARRNAAVIALTVPMLAGFTRPPAPAVAWAPLYSGSTGTDTLVTRVLTPDGSDRYSVTKSGGQVTVTASRANTGGNLREVFWPAGTPALANTQVCATWEYEPGSTAQEGLAERITGTPSDTFAITETKNVFGGAFWVVNVHTWDTASAQPFTLIAQFDYSNVVIQNGALSPFPWRVCAHVIGSALGFKLWVPALEAEPSWSDPAYTRIATIPSGYLGAGETGWYTGHISAGGSVGYGGLGIWHWARGGYRSRLPVRSYHQQGSAPQGRRIL
jgi:hypothetical protein